LNVSRLIQSGDARDCAKVCIGNHGAWKTVLHVVQRIEHVRAHGELVPFPRHREYFHESEIERLRTIEEERVATEYRRIEVGGSQRTKRSTRQNVTRIRGIVNVGAEYLSIE